MNGSFTTIKCPHCNQQVEISQALKHEFEEGIVAAQNAKHQIELDRVQKEALEVADKKIREQFEIQLKNLQKETQEEKERNQKLTKQLNDLLEEMRQMRRKDEERETEFKQKILNEEEKIRIEAAKKVEEEHKLKDLEKDKKISDALKQVEEMKVKMQQGSQQTQGEVLELELEALIKKEFPMDEINEVAKGVRGADLVQEVFDKNGQKCGIILWESKNAQWTDKWISKLKEDQREIKADLAILVSINLPEEVKSYKDGVWIASRATMLSMANILRFSLIQANFLKKSQEGKKEKAEILYNYLSSHEFRQRVDSLTENYARLQKELEDEKQYFARKWARQEKSLRQLTDQTHGFYGDLQGIIGSSSLPELGDGNSN